MIEGTILNYKDNNGQIKGDDGKTYTFNRRAIKQGSVDDSTPGRRTRFQPDGDRAHDVTLLDTVVELAKPTPKPATPSLVAPKPADATTPASPMSLSRSAISSPRPASGGSYRFLNPYNFVRYLEKERPKEHLLGDCAPPPHDRYVGLMGVITCRVQNVTPLFVSDSHDIEPDEEHPGHKSYQFFRLPDEHGDLKPALPAASLRGMLRAVFEAATNSCFGVFERDEEKGKVDRLEHRVSSDPGLVPARVLDVDATGAKLELFDCTTMAPPVPCTDKPATVRSGMVSAYKPVVLKKLRGGHDIPFSSYGVVTPVFEDGERVAALVETTRVKHRTNHFQWFPVVKMASQAHYGSLVAGPGHRKVFGYVHKTGPNIENKHDERLFFRWDDTDPIPQTTYSPKTLTVDIKVVGEYDRILRKYRDRHSEEVNQLQAAGWPVSATTLPFPSVFVRKDRQLRKHDLVYYFKDSRGTEHICPISMPRIPYQHPREALLPKYIHPCKSYNALCPACRTFGWVHEDAATLPPATKVAYASRVRVTHGTLRKSAGTFDDPDGDGIRLAILSSPKPTATAFYLLPKSGKPGEATYDDKQNTRLRGRKFYRHHGQWEELSADQQQEHRRAGNKPDKQNRTVKGVLNPGAEFEFEVHFENLQPIELGALLWTIQLEQGMHHRLGFAKPLGFGSMTVLKCSLQIVRSESRYKSLISSGSEEEAPTASILLYVDRFKDALQLLYGAKDNSFEMLPNIADLRALLSKPKIAATLHVHYPRHERRASVDGENFKWFVGNRKRLEDSKRAQDRRRLPLGSDPEWLSVAAEDREGLKLMNEEGYEVQ